MKKIIIFIMACVIGIGIFFGMKMNSSDKTGEQAQENNKNEIQVGTLNETTGEQLQNEVSENKNQDATVIIKNGTVENEDAIENFISNTGISFSEKLILKIREYTTENAYDEKILEFVPGEYGKSLKDGTTSTIKLPDHNGTYEEFKNAYGYFRYDDGIKEEDYRGEMWILERIIKENNIEFRIGAGPLIEITSEDELPVICTYSIESSNYQKNVDMQFSQRKNKDIKKIIDSGSSEDYDFSVYTYGGDVNFLVEDDMVYTFEKALKEKVVTVDDILEQAKMDKKYGLCEIDSYKDGGTIEYRYKDYTIVKYSTLDGNQDFVVGPQGSIRNEIDKKLYNK